MISINPTEAQKAAVKLLKKVPDDQNVEEAIADMFKAQLEGAERAAILMKKQQEARQKQLDEANAELAAAPKAQITIE